jgi:hypothetical protein
MENLVMKDSKVLFMPTPRMEVPAVGDRPEPALHALIAANQRVFDFAERAFKAKHPEQVPASEIAHLIRILQKSEIMFEIGRDCFPFSAFRYEHFRANYKEKAVFLHELFIESAQREIALNCKKAAT